MENRPEITRFLAGFKVLDLTEESGVEEKGHHFCSQILGELGAKVTRVEKPGVRRDFWWWAYNSKKELVYLDIAKEPEKLLELVKEADILVESYAPGYMDKLGLGYSRLKEVNPRLIMTSMTAFGQAGPYRDFKASDLEVMALSGIIHGMGDPDRPPVRISFPQSFLITSAEGAVGTLIALCQRELTGEGQQVDVSAQESVLMMKENRVRRQGVLGSRSRLGGFHPTMESIKPTGGHGTYFHPRHPQIWKCKDGHIAFLLHPGMIAPETNRILVKYMEKEGPVPDLVRNMHWETFDWTETNFEDANLIWKTFADFFMKHTYKELYDIALKERIMLFPGYTVKDLLTDEQLAARQYWQEMEVPDLGKKLKFPGPFARIQFPPADAITPRRSLEPGLPFKGVKVLDFTWVVVGPWMTQWLALYGAELIRVESAKAGPQGRRSRGNDFQFVAYNTSKKSLEINIKTPQGKDMIRQLVAWADVVTDNFSPGTMQRLGLGYEELLKINPRIIQLSTSMLGASGPHTTQPGLGQILSSLSGFTDLTGWPDRLQVTAHGPYTDVISCRIGAATLFAALDYQMRTGKGCRIDLSQFETSVHFLIPLVLKYQVDGSLYHRMGNRSLTDCPHGVFPCRGEDRWCAISTSNEAEWQAFCKAAGKEEEWAQDQRYVTMEKRKQNEDELEKLISAWTKEYTPEEIMYRLQKVGVKAGAVLGPDQLLMDPQLAYRHHFVTLKHEELGEYDFNNSGFRLEKAPASIVSAPLFGEHTRYICTEILGLSEAEYETCLKAGVFV